MDFNEISSNSAVHCDQEMYYAIIRQSCHEPSYSKV